MKRNTHRSRNSAQPPVWRREENAALQANAANGYDDRDSGILFDAEDERAEVDIIVHRLNHDAG